MDLPGAATYEFFEGDVLERIVETITSDRRLWVDTMITEEYGLPLEGPDPFRAGATTFAAFCGVGLVPLLPYLVTVLPTLTQFAASSVLTAMAFAAIGWVKGVRLQRPRLASAWETLWTGGVAAVLAYAAGWGLRAVFGTH